MNTLPSIKDYLVEPIVSKLSDEELTLRDSIMHEIRTTHQAYAPKNSKEEKLLHTMSRKNTLAITNGKVTGIYPVSAIKTNKKVFFEDGLFSYAMCAIDAIGYHYAFQKPIRIESECEQSKEKLILTVENGKVNVVTGSNEIYVLHTDLKNSDNWSGSCCNIMHFFSCKNKLEEWKKENDIQSKVFSIDLETANKIAWLLFSN